MLTDNALHQHPEELHNPARGVALEDGVTPGFQTLTTG